MIISGLETNKIHFKIHCFVYKQAKWAFLITFCYNVFVYNWFYDINLTISPLDKPITAEFTKGFYMITSLINILCL